MMAGVFYEMPAIIVPSHVLAPLSYMSYENIIYFKLFLFINIDFNFFCLLYESKDNIAIASIMAVKTKKNKFSITATKFNVMKLV